MTEEKIKKRGWIKNVAIIFLAVLLVLTFFSNTIMNRSLPEVAAQYVQSGTITAKIRGTGTVTANETYEVKVDQTREVHSIPVRVGDAVEVGDVLLILAEGDSQELADTKATLESKRLEYQKAVIQNTGKDYSQQQREIDRAREDLTEAVAKRDELVITEEELDSAKSALANAKAVTLVCQADVNTAQANLDALGGSSGGGDYSSLYSALQQAQTEINSAKDALETANLVYGAGYAEVRAEALARMEADGIAANDQAAKVNIYMAAVVEEWRNAKEHTELISAYDAILTAEKGVTSAQDAYNAALGAYNAAAGSDNSAQYSSLLKKLNTAKEAQTAAENTQSRLQSNYDKLAAQYEEWKTAADSVKSLEDKVDDLVFALSETQKTDGVTDALAALDMQVLRDDIAELETKLTSLEGGSTDSSVTSRVAGVIRAVNITAGSTTSAGAALMTIDVVDRGYSTSISVTNEQSKRVNIGDVADVGGYYWGGSGITATLAAIKTDTENPTKNKLLVFDVTGEVTAGTQLSLTVSQRSANYDAIIPNSAKRTDSNGDFVLVVTAKSSPLGNRYVATRVNVQVLASDDVNTAVSGGLTTSDYVITTSTELIEPGMLIRLPENN